MILQPSATAPFAHYVQARQIQRAMPMVGDLPEAGLKGGFRNDPLGPSQVQGFMVARSMPTPILATLTRGAAGNTSEANAEIRRAIDSGQIADVNALLLAVSRQTSEVERLLSTATANLPIRENLEAEAKDLVPKDTPFRNMCPRTPGAGLASLWKLITSLGGGWDPALDQPGSTATARMFMSETGAPAEVNTAFSTRTAAYKILASYRSITGFAAAAGANFANYMADERVRCIQNTMLNEENALINGDASSILAPWGDGASALAFDGLVKSIKTANGTPAAQIQSAIGGLTFAYIDQQLTRLWKAGYQNPFIMVNAQEALSITHLATQTGQVTMFRVLSTDSGTTAASMIVSHYIHPQTGEKVAIRVSRFMYAGTMIIGCLNGPNGDPSFDVDVLPQVQLPALAPNSQIQGYVLQELAPSQAAPQVYPFMVSVYEVFRLKLAASMTLGTGITAV